MKEVANIFPLVLAFNWGIFKDDAILGAVLFLLAYSQCSF